MIKKRGIILLMWIVMFTGLWDFEMSESIGAEPSGRHREQKEVPLTAEQQKKVTEILSQYDPEELTATQAKAINDAFRKAGIKRGPGQQQAIEATGFDPRKISELDPPPEPGSGEKTEHERRPPSK